MDRRAYLASTAPEPAAVEDFFYSQLVMSEGAPFRCIHTDTIKEVGWGWGVGGGLWMGGRGYGILGRYM
jgi:hypothetical protein